jgi:hypothetical protein
MRALEFVGGQRDGPIVGLQSVGRAPKALQQLSTGRVQ